MKIQPGVTKRSVLLIWGFAISFFLYYFSVSMEAGISLMNFMNFAILMWGGGAAYHITCSLVACPQTQHNAIRWMSLLKKLSKVYIGYVIAGIAVIAGRELNGEWGWILAFLGIVLGFILAMNYILDLSKPIKLLLESQENGQTSACVEQQ
ncbi:MAG: hypothetical protein AAGC78_06870 [Cellvibrio sp.]|uniref:hypothetical protein n=1 Tax=Cellvibrio sp. TaxID=1965322 RepID=UPI0031A4A2D1